MNKLKLTIVFILFFTPVFGQQTDTLSFYSNVFDSERTIHVTKPEFYKYQSKEVKLPVIFLLDGQHEWFVNPIQNTIYYLQFTHQIPQALIVTIPLQDRIKECTIDDINELDLPLLKFITEEVDSKLQVYNPNEFKIIIGHSFSASFSLYSYLKKPNYFSAVIANTPMDKFEKLVTTIENNKEINKDKIFISVGGSNSFDDGYHRATFDNLRKKYPSFFNSINSYVSENTNHNSVPIIATPYFLKELFSDFNGRYSQIAAVDSEYKLNYLPESVEQEMYKIEHASKIFDSFYPPELPEINGIASRYWNSNLLNYAEAVYLKGLKYYPDYFEFHLQLYELLVNRDKEKAKYHLNKAKELLEIIETESTEKVDILDEINLKLRENDW